MLLHVESHRKVKQLTGIHLRVLVDGVDVTRWCASADAEAGWALCYRKDEEGRPYLRADRTGAAMVLLSGEVLFVRSAEAI